MYWFFIYRLIERAPESASSARPDWAIRRCGQQRSGEPDNAMDWRFMIANGLKRYMWLTWTARQPPQCDHRVAWTAFRNGNCYHRIPVSTSSACWNLCPATIATSTSADAGCVLDPVIAATLPHLGGRFFRAVRRLCDPCDLRAAGRDGYSYLPSAAHNTVLKKNRAPLTRNAAGRPSLDQANCFTRGFTSIRRHLWSIDSRRVIAKSNAPSELSPKSALFVPTCRPTYHIYAGARLVSCGL